MKARVQLQTTKTAGAPALPPRVLLKCCKVYELSSVNEFHRSHCKIVERRDHLIQH